MQDTKTFSSFSGHLINAGSLPGKIILSLGAAVVLTVSAWIAVPLFPISLTMQSLAVILIGGLLGPALGVTAVIIYLLAGVAGLPVFSGGSSGLDALISATFGYKVGFIFAALLAGNAATRALDRNFFSALLRLAVAHLTIFISGLFWLIPHFGVKNAIMSGVVPFLGADAIKFILAAVLLNIAWEFSRPARSRTAHPSEA